jgi:hypothetical protein
VTDIARHADELAYSLDCLAVEITEAGADETTVAEYAAAARFLLRELTNLAPAAAFLAGIHPGVAQPDPDAPDDDDDQDDDDDDSTVAVPTSVPDDLPGSEPNPLVDPDETELYEGAAAGAGAFAAL